MDSAQHRFVSSYWPQLDDALRRFQGSEKNGDDGSPGLFADILGQLTRAYVGSQWRSLSYLWDKYEAGLKHAREGKLSSAEQIFTEVATARSHFKDSYFNNLIDVAGLPSVAYLRYKQGCFDDAEAMLTASIDSDAKLLPEGFYILEYHRVQQLHNLARLYFRQGLLEKGAAMIATALRFITYGHAPVVGAGDGWSAENTQRIPAQLCSDMLFQLTNETVGLFLAHPSKNNELCRIAFANLTFWEARTDDEAVLLQWFMLKERYARGQFDELIRESIPFLTRHSVLFDYYKLSILMDIVEGVGQYNGYTASVSQVINDFMDKLNVGTKQRETCSLFVHQLMGNEQEADMNG